MSKLTVTIPDDLHQKIREELERQGITTSQFIEQAVTTFFEKPKGVSNMATRTLAFQVSEELLQRIKTFLARYEQIYHRKLSQKEFLVHFQRKSTAQYAALYALEKGRPRKDLYGAAERICNRKLFAYSNQSVRMNSNRRFCQSIIDCNVIRKRFWNHLWMTCLGYGICKNKNIKNALHLEKIFSILQNRNTILPESIH